MSDDRKPFDPLVFTVCYALSCKEAQPRWPKLKRGRHRLEMDDYEPLAQFILDQLRRSKYEIVKGEVDLWGPGQYARTERSDDVQPLQGGGEQAGPE